MNSDRDADDVARRSDIVELQAELKLELARLQARLMLTNLAGALATGVLVLTAVKL